MLAGMRPKDAIRYNQEVRLSREQIGRWINHFELIEGTVEPDPVPPAPKSDSGEGGRTPAYTAVHKGAGRYDVVSQSGEAANEHKLSKEEAQELADQLNQES